MTTAMAPARRATEVEGGDEVDRLLESIDMGPSVPRDIIQMKMENEQLFAEARMHKRDHKRLLEDIKDQLTSYRSFALTAMYAKNVGKDDKGKEKIARGLSIRAAEAIKCALGCNRLAVALTPLDKWQVLVSVTFTDFLNLTTETRQEIVSRKYTGWKYVNGKKTDQREEKITEESRFNATVVKAAVSRCAREAILRSTPPGLRTEMEVLAQNAAELYMDDDTFKKIVDSFAGKGVHMTALEKHLGKRADNWSVNDRVDLMALWNGIRSGDVDPTAVGEEEDELPPQSAKAKSDAAPAPAPKSKTLDELKAQLRDRANELNAGEVVDALGEGGLKGILDRGVKQEIKDAEVLLSNIILRKKSATAAAPKAAEPEKPAGVPISEAPDGTTAAEPAQGELPLTGKPNNKKTQEWAKK